MRRFRKEFGIKKARIQRERLIPISQGLKIGINRQPLSAAAKYFLAQYRLTGVNPYTKPAQVGSAMLMAGI